MQHHPLDSRVGVGKHSQPIITITFKRCIHSKATANGTWDLFSGCRWCRWWERENPHQIHFGGISAAQWSPVSHWKMQEHLCTYVMYYFTHYSDCGHNSSRTLFLMLQWQQTVHRYLRVLHSRMMKRPPKNVTMEEARNAHHMRCPLLSQGTSDENGMTTSSILDIKIEESGFILLLILLVLIELSLPWGTVPSASASI